MLRTDSATQNDTFEWEIPKYRNNKKTFKQAAYEATLVLVAAYALSVFAKPFRTPLVGMAFGFAVTHIAIYTNTIYICVVKLSETPLGQKILLDHKLTVIMLIFSFVLAEQLWVVSLVFSVVCGIEARFISTGFYSGFGTTWKKIWSH